MHRALIQTVPTRTPQRTNGDGLLLVPDHMMRKLVVTPPHRSPSLRPFAWRQANRDGSPTARFIHTPPLQQNLAASNHRVRVRAVASASLYGRLHADVSIARQFSRISLLTLGHSRRCLSRALRHGAALLLRLSENLFGKSPHRTRTKRFSEPSAKAPLGTWERGTSRRFAQECPEGNPGKYTQGETQWHSTKTSRN